MAEVGEKIPSCLRGERGWERFEVLKDQGVTRKCYLPLYGGPNLKLSKERRGARFCPSSLASEL